MTRRPPFLLTLLAGSVLGSVAALIELWPYPLSLRGAVAILGAGAAWGAVLATSVRFVPTPSRLAWLGAWALGGGVGGAAWWLLLRPAGTLLAAAVVGGVLALGIVALEEFFGQAAA